MKSKNLKLILRCLSAFLLLAVLLIVVDWEKGLRRLVELEPSLVFPAFLLFPFALCVASLRWLALLRPHGLRPPLWEVFRGYWIGLFVSNFLPSNIGGDISRIGVLSRYKRTAEIAGSVVVERLCGFSALLVLSCFTAMLHPEYFFFRGGVALFWGGAVFLLLTLILTGFATNAFMKWTPLKEDGSISSKLLVKIKKLTHSIHFYRDNPLVLVKAVVLSFCYYFVGIVVQYFYVLSLDLNVGFLDVFFIAPIIYLISLIPISLNSIGLAEGAFVLFYTQIGISQAEALALAFLARFVQVLCSGCGGIFLLFGRFDLVNND